ncbi:modification methylase MboII [archaeon]|nr:modification methylase MboII [archaeon]
MLLYSYKKYILIRKNLSKIKQKIYIEKELNLEKCFKLYNGEDIIEMNIVKNVNKDKTAHVCQLPVKLVDIFVKASSNKNDIVFDPFMGSGTVAFSAKKKQKKIYWF